MKKNNQEFKPTYFLTDEQIEKYKNLSSSQIFEWLETTNEFLYKCRTPEAKAFSAKLRRGEI
jgi:hypothetical protein